MNCGAIERVYARLILDSRGNSTLEFDVTVRSGACGLAAVPSGASTGSREALELRDRRLGMPRQGRAAGDRERQNGEIALVLIGQNASNPHDLDRTLIGGDAR